MNIQALKTELDRAVEYVVPTPVGFTKFRPNIKTEIKKEKDAIIYTIKIK